MSSTDPANEHTLLGLDLKSGSVLTIGDGNCSYSAALVRARPELKIVASTYDALQRIPKETVEGLPTLLTEVDFTDALPEPGRWDRIICNFPAPIGRRQVSRARCLLRQLFLRISEAIAPSGQGWVTLEESAANAASDGTSWDLFDAAADAGLVVCFQGPANANSAYQPEGVKSQGVLHIVSKPGEAVVACRPAEFERDVNLRARATWKALEEEVRAACSPIGVSLKLLNTFVEGQGAQSAAAATSAASFAAAVTESWTVRLRLTTDRHPLSRRLAHGICQRLEGRTGGEGDFAAALEMPARKRRRGWAVWFHKVEPSVEDLLSLITRPVARPEDATLLWTNATWTHESAWVNHFDDAVLNKRDVALKLRGLPFLPKTFVLPEENDEWMEASASHWITKPARAGRGINVMVFPDSNRAELSSGVVSEYVANPFLIDGRKSDLRLYVALLSLDPLRGFLHRNGYVRFAALPYSLADLSPQRHLTNNSINRSAAVAPPTVPGLDIGVGDNWPLKALWNVLDRQTVWPRVHTLVTAVLQGIAPHLKKKAGTRPFAFLGFDVLLDEGGTPFLCEINANPTLEAKRVIDREVDLEVVGDLLLLLEGDSPARWEEVSTT